MASVGDNVPYWLALAKVDGLAVRGAHKLVEYFGSCQAVYQASRTELEGCGLPARTARAIFAQSGLNEAEKEKGAAEKAGCQLVAYSEDGYPPLLREMADPPLVLYVRGMWACFLIIVSPWLGRAVRRLMESQWRIAWHAIWRNANWSSSAGSPGE
jgi:predicted Rossmann fold nucleotide-binding protein DprA/Smf involved in DNA uptake